MTAATLTQIAAQAKTLAHHLETMATLAERVEATYAGFHTNSRNRQLAEELVTHPGRWFTRQELANLIGDPGAARTVPTVVARLAANGVHVEKRVLADGVHEYRVNP